jgi:hypothetical protein
MDKGRQSSKEGVTIMDNFTKLLLFLGQQLFVYKRRVIFSEELKQIISSDEEIIEHLDEFEKNGWIQKFMDEYHFEITVLAETTILSYWNKNVFITGEVGGGSLSGDPSDHRFTVTIEFDSPVKFIEHTKIKYEDKDIFLNCVEGFYYEAKVFVQKESDFEAVEESINRYLSHLSYHYKVPISIKATHSGSINISSTTKRTNPRTGIYYPLPQLPNLTEKMSRSVAFYRQFRNFSQIETTESRYYQLMSLLKIIEGVSPSVNLAQNKIDFLSLVDKYLLLLSQQLQSQAKGVEAKYSLKYGTVLPFSEITWEHYRNGVAHWRARGNFLDPDIPDYTIATSINILEQIVILAMNINYKIPA